MTSQGSQFASSARLCMPLAKFSYATVHATSTAPIPWTHLISHNDLFVIIDEMSANVLMGNQLKCWRLKVLQDPNFHEDIDLSLLAQEARKAISQTQFLRESRQQPAITVIVKLPCVAMRYPLEGDRIRRFQVRFANHEDYYETLKVLTRENVPFIEAGATPSRPATAPHDNRLVPVETNTLRPMDQLHISGTVDSTGGETQSGELGKSFLSSAAVVDHRSTLSSVSQPLPNDRVYSTNKAFSSFLRSSSNLNPDNQGRTTAINHHSTPSNHCYTPRPSTAPVAPVASLNTELPPRRELPFMRKGSSVQSMNEETVSDQDIIEKDDGIKDSSEMNSKTRLRKRPATKAQKSPRAKKQQVSTSRKGKANQKSTEKDRVLSVEELLERDGIYTALKAKNTDEVDTQVLIDQAEAKLQARSVAAKQTKGHVLISMPEKDQHCRSVDSLPQQLSHGGPNRSAPGQEHNNAILERAGISTTTCVGAHAPLGLQSQQQQQQHLTSLTPSQFRTTTTENLEEPSLPPKILASLLCTNLALTQTIQLNNPQDGSTDANFDNLSDSQRHALAESWILQNFENDDFLNLCRTLEGIWQRALLKF